MTHAFVALYAGDTVAEAKIVAASTDPYLVDLAIEIMLRAEKRAEQEEEGTIKGMLNTGRRTVLKLLKTETETSEP